MKTHPQPTIELHSGTVLFPHKLPDMQNPLGEHPCFILTHSQTFLNALVRTGEPARLIFQSLNSDGGQGYLLIGMHIADVLGVTLANLAEPAVQACLEGAMAEETLTLHTHAQWGFPTITVPVECPGEYLRAWLDHGRALPRLPYEARLADLLRSIEWLKSHATQFQSPTGQAVSYVSLCGVVASRKD